MFSMQTTVVERVRGAAEERWVEQQRRVDELAVLSAHLNAATARWLELAWERRDDDAGDDPARCFAFRCGITVREARELLRVAEALQGLPVTRAAFARGELTLTKVRALTRVATASCEEGLLGLAQALTASQLERALRVFRRVSVQEARDRHELEFVDYFFEEDGSLYLRARLAAEDGTLVVMALEAAREQVVERRRQQRAAAESDTDADADGGTMDAGLVFEPPRSTRVEALVELAEAALAAPHEHGVIATRLLVHVDAAALTADGRGRCELEHGSVIAPETARRLGCDSELVARLEHDGLPVSAGRRRRTVPPALRRLLEARHDSACCFPGCERRRHLQAHHRHHWAHGGDTSLANLVLLCFHHHRLVHEGGYTIEDDPAGGLRFRNRHGLVCPTAPTRPPPGSLDQLRADNHHHGIDISPHTNRNGHGDRLHLDLIVTAIAAAVGQPDDP
jgi:hypothetical protein